MSVRRRIGLLVALLMLAVPSAAGAAPIVQTSLKSLYPSSSVTPMTADIVTGPGGAVYVSVRLGNATFALANLSAKPMTSTQCNFQGQPCAIGGITVSGGALWFVSTIPINAQGVTASPSIGTVGPVATGVAAFLVQGLGYTDLPYGIASDDSGALWLSQGQGVIARYVPGSTPIDQYTLAGDAVTNYPIPVSTGGPIAITRGPDGAMWFTQTAGNTIGRVATTAPETVGAMRQYAVPTPRAGLSGIAPGPDGALWFAEARAGKIGRITTDGQITEFQIPIKGAAPRNVVAGPDNAIWFTDPGTNAIGRMTTAGAVTEYALTTARSVPSAITLGGDGGIWFTMPGLVGVVGRLDPASPPTPAATARARVTRNGRLVSPLPGHKAAKKKTKKKR